jgi:acetyltransferase-like isoleucine patch superfamily enzyme
VKPIISPNTRVRHPAALVVGPDSIIDDFCYLSTRVTIGRCSHLASGCSIAGGGERHFSLGDFSSLSSGVKVWCTSDDFVNDLVTIIPADIGDEPIKQNLISGDVSIGNYTAIGSNSVIMPGNDLPDGTAIGALSFVPARFEFEPWSVYAGVPIRRLGARNKEQVLEQARKLDAALERRDKS